MAFMGLTYYDSLLIPRQKRMLELMSRDMWTPMVFWEAEHIWF